MAYPDDLSDVVLLKIHPAIGVARVADNDDYYVFGTPPEFYKSNGVMKRQAVQFRVFAYGENHVGLGELTPQIMAALGITAVWSARVANRKITYYRGLPLSSPDFVISASARSDDANGGALTGSIATFDEGAAIPLGQITAEGLFIPPRGDVFRETAGEPIIPYPARSKTVADTTCDGSIEVELTSGGDVPPVLAACIVVAPQDFSPDVDLAGNLESWLRNKLQIPASNSGNIHNDTARALDLAAIRSCTNDFAPGYEVGFSPSRGEVPSVQPLFYHPNQDPEIAPGELRVRYGSGAGTPGAIPGQLTSGLCSTWQGDFTACVGYWGENLPTEAYLDEDNNQSVQFFRRVYADYGGAQGQLETGDDFNDHVDEIGVVRRINSKQVETEREPGDDIQP